MRGGTVKKTKLHSVPYDVLYQIVGDIDLSDFINLGRVNKTLYNLLLDDRLAKRNVKKYVRHSKEGKLAFSGKITYRQAISRLHDIRHAVAMAEPYSVAVLSYAATFIYQEGVLSYMANNEIHVLDVHRAAMEEQVVDIQNVLRRIIPTFRYHEAEGRSAQISFLHYSSGVLAFLVEMSSTDAWLILLDVTPGGSQQPRGYKPGRLRFVTQLGCTRRLFVRHNGVHLFYGVNSTVDASGELLWAIQWVDLTKDNRVLATPPTVLDNLAGTDLGHNVCFEIFDNHLYAVSNTIDSEEETLNWRSYYEWVSIAPACGRRRARGERIWRRDHLEGPINDTWTEISLRQDEETGKPMILECRREWREGGSDHVRTYYAEPLPHASELVTVQNEAEDVVPRETQPTPVISQPPNLFEGGTRPSNITLPLPLNGLSTEDIARHRRPGRHVHSEYTSNCCTRRDFILAKTKYRTYNLSACAFIDLVNDPEPNNRVGVTTDRLRLRVNSRKRKRTEDDVSDDNRVTKYRLDESFLCDNERQASDQVRLWPSDNADEELINFLCPSRRATNMHSVADERSLVYSVDTGEGPQNQAIILISFDPQIQLPCMMRHKIRNASASSTSSPSPFVNISLFGPETTNTRQKYSLLSPSSSVSSSKSSVRTEPAMHLSIDRGYWFDVKRE